VEVVASQDQTTQVSASKGDLSVNAQPWAEVFVDGEDVGQTPIANLSVPVGTYEVVFRHPELGERRQTITVTASSTNRVAVDFTK
jgi:serine/threonine-protein kinase